MAPETPRVCAIVLNLGGMSVMEDCLRSLAAADYPALEVFVVHNGPLLVGFREAAKAACPRVSEVVFAGANLGFAAGNNLGIKEALARGAEYVLLLNDDTLVAPELLSRLVGCAETEKEGGAFGPIILLEDQASTVWFAGARFEYADCSLHTPGSGGSPDDLPNKPYLSDYLTGCCLLFTHRALAKTGLLDERFFLYWEDTDWCLRSMAAGFKNYVVPSARIWHRVSASSGGMNSPLRIYHKTRSHLLFAHRHSPHALPVLQRRFLRDMAWIFLKSEKPCRCLRALAIAAALRDYRLDQTGAGSAWLWRCR